MTEARTAERTALIAAIRAATAAMLPDTAATRFHKAMDRLGRLLAERALERRYNPDWASQPRVSRAAIPAVVDGRMVVRRSSERNLTRQQDT